MIKLIKSSFYQEENIKKGLIKFIMSSKFLSMDSQCRQFEKKFAQKQKRRFGVFVNSGSTANLVLLQSLVNLGSLKKNDLVGFSSLTWATNVMPLIQVGLSPLALDCEIENLNVSEEIIKKTVSRHNLRALFLTNAMGFAADLPAIRSLCQKKKILLLEDNCESLGSKIGGKLLGNFGLASTFSFFVGHHLSTIEGGMICTDSKELYEMMLIVRAHGWDRNLPLASQARLRRHHRVDDFYALYTFYDLAYSVRPTELQGFIGNKQLKYFEEIISKRQEIFFRFKKNMEKNNDFFHLKLGHMQVISNFAMPVVCRNEKIATVYKRKFKDAGVEIRPIIAGDITRQPFYKKYVKTESKCPGASLIHNLGFYFPNNPELTEKEINLLCGLLVSGKN